MKYLYVFLAMMIAGCNSGDQQKEPAETTDSANLQEPALVDQTPIPSTDTIKQNDSLSKLKLYSNKRFKEVTAKKTGDHLFLIRGKGQIFEASFGWVVEDGHEELKKGFEMTDAGAPEWGNFSFTVDVQKVRPNSTLHLVLFETSAKDGSRQYELPVLLY